MKRSNYREWGFLCESKIAEGGREREAGRPWKTRCSDQAVVGMCHKFLSMFFIICAFNAAGAHAQTVDTPRSPYTFRNDVFLGGGYTRAASGTHLDSTNFGGWNISTTHYFSPIWGATLDVQGAYGHAPLKPTSGSSLDPFVYKHIFLAGPQIRWRRRERYSSSIRLLAGVTDSIYDSDTGGVSPATLGLYTNATKLAFKPGGAFDYNLSPRVALRVSTGFLLERQGGSFQSDINLSTGFLFRLGKQKN